MVLVLFGVASIVHFAYLAFLRSRGQGGNTKGLQISLLARRKPSQWHGHHEGIGRRTME